jgi:hypothetical protein
MVDTDIGTAEKLVLAGVLVVGLSLLVPYLTASEPLLLVDGERETSQLGVQTADGKLMFGAAVLAGVVAVFGSWGLLASGFVGLSGLGITALALLYLSDPVYGAEYSSADVVSEIDPGIGLYLAALCGLLVLGGTYKGRQTRSRSGGGQPRGPVDAPPGERVGAGGAPNEPAGTPTDRAPGPARPTGGESDERPIQPVADRPRRTTTVQSPPENRAGGQPTDDRWVPGSSWNAVAAGGLALFLIAFSVLLGDALDLTRAITESGEVFIGLLLMLSWVLIPLGTLLDLRYVHARTAWNPRTLVWGIPIVVPFLNALVVAAYLYRRRTAVGGTGGESE